MLHVVLQQQSVKESESKDCLDALKVALEAAIPPTEVEVTIFGSVYYIFVFKDNYQISKITNQDQLQFLNARLSIDSLKADIFKKVNCTITQSLDSKVLHVLVLTCTLFVKDNYLSS